jgi:hypothetical protein
MVVMLYYVVSCYVMFYDVLLYGVMLYYRVVLCYVNGMRYHGIMLC